MKKIELYEYWADGADNLLIQREVNKSSWLSGAHYHNCVELCFVLDGINGCCVNGEMHYVNAGEIAFIDSLETHYFDIIKGAETVDILLAPSWLESFYALYRKGDIVPYFNTMMTDVSRNEKAYDILLRWVDDYDVCTKLQHQGYANLLFGEMARVYGVKNDKKKSKNNNLVVKMLHYMQAHYLEEISLKKLSEHVQYSENHCSRIFHAAVGQDMRTYINGLRVEKAREMLQNYSELTVLQVALDSGFDSLNTFYRAYAKRYGELPKRK